MNDAPTTTVLFIDGHSNDRKYWVDWLKSISREYLVLEADSGAAGLEIFRSQRVDCVVLELTQLDMSGFQVLLNLIPLATRPKIAVIMLTRLDLPPMGTLAKSNGAQAYLVKSRTTGDELDRAILKAVSTIGSLSKEHR